MPLKTVIETYTILEQKYLTEQQWLYLKEFLKRMMKEEGNRTLAQIEARGASGLQTIM